MAAQLMAMKGLSRRGLSRCTARATTSLPVPLSPQISTLEGLSAMRWSNFLSVRMGWLSPISCISPSSGSGGWLGTPWD
ncbi:hypothetical protein D3C80_1999230 [compost metagenome]